MSNSIHTIFGAMADVIYQYISDVRTLSLRSSSETYKIAAKMHGIGPENSVISFSRPNIKLPILKEIMDTHGSIGGASDTIHAETAVIMGAPVTDQADLFVSDPLCPNCMKNSIEAGFKRIFIDKNGFDKPWYQKRKGYFDHISLKLAALAGVEVFVVDPDTRDIQALTPPPAPGQAIGQAEHHNPPEIIPLKHGENLEDFIESSRKKYGKTPFALSTGLDNNGRRVLIRASEDFSKGLTKDMTQAIVSMAEHNEDSKYSLKNDPVIRLMMAASKYGISLRGSHMYCSHLPSPRCLIDAVGYGMQDIRVSDIHDNTSSASLDAACLLSSHNIMKFHFDDPNISIETAASASLTSAIEPTKH